MNIINCFAPHFLRKIQLYPETVIIIASDPAIEVLKTYGNNIFFIDSTHSLIDGQMQLCGIAVRDSFGSISFFSLIHSFITIFHSFTVL
jgi:hypothetical protein